MLLKLVKMDSIFGKLLKMYVSFSGNSLAGKRTIREKFWGKRIKFTPGIGNSIYLNPKKGGVLRLLERVKGGRGQFGRGLNTVFGAFKFGQDNPK